ncbi:MAG: hypothetical protein ACYTHJ_11255 [Planctomycetota bacterium]|jgi:hypothetical protein
MRQLVTGLTLISVLAVSQAAPAQTPTYLIRLTEVNSTPINGKGAADFKVAPGDRLKFHVLLRDWSPNGEMAAAVQADLDTMSFQSGDSGTIRPIAYDVTTLRNEQNSLNASIEETNRNHLHYGRQKVAFTTSNTVEHYRWMSVLFGKVGPISRQDGSERYIGTVQSEVSSDASGTFTYRLIPGQEHCGILTFEQTPVWPIDVEDARITVVPNPERRWIISSSPEWGSVDARSSKRGAGIDSVTLRMTTGAEDCSAADFSVFSSSGESPGVKSVKASGRKVLLTFDGPLAPEAWTTITHEPSGTSTRIGRFYGDTSADGHTDFDDLSSMLARINKEGMTSNLSGDLDGDGTVAARDVIALLSHLCETD